MFVCLYGGAGKVWCTEGAARAVPQAGGGDGGPATRNHTLPLRTDGRLVYGRTPSYRGHPCKRDTLPSKDSVMSQ